MLKPGGRLVVHDLYRGPGSPVHFPAFWGQDDSISFLVSDAEMRELLEAPGFRVTHWQDTSESAHAANDAMDEDHAKSELEAETIEGLDIFLLFGEQTLVMAENSGKAWRSARSGSSRPCSGARNWYNNERACPDNGP